MLRGGGGGSFKLVCANLETSCCQRFSRFNEFFVRLGSIVYLCAFSGSLLASILEHFTPQRLLFRGSHGGLS